MRFLWAVLAIYAASASANEKPVITPTPTPSESVTSESTSDSTSGATASSSGGSSNAVSNERSTAIAVGNTAPTPLHDTPPCWLPPKGVRSVRQVLFGVFTKDPRLMRNAECMDDVKAAREYELAKLEAEADLERLRIERIKADSSRVEAVRK